MLYDPKWEITINTDEPWRLVLLVAADAVRKRGLAKFTQITPDGRVCLHGAIEVARRDTGTNWRFCKAEDHIARYLREVVKTNLVEPHSTGCAHWNNTPERTADEVITALEGAAAWRG